MPSLDLRAMQSMNPATHPVQLCAWGALVAASAWPCWPAASPTWEAWTWLNCLLHLQELVLRSVPASVCLFVDQRQRLKSWCNHVRPARHVSLKGLRRHVAWLQQHRMCGAHLHGMHVVSWRRLILYWACLFCWRYMIDSASRRGHVCRIHTPAGLLQSKKTKELSRIMTRGVWQRTCAARCSRALCNRVVARPTCASLCITPVAALVCCEGSSSSVVSSETSLSCRRCARPKRTVAPMRELGTSQEDDMIADESSKLSGERSSSGKAAVLPGCSEGMLVSGPTPLCLSASALCTSVLPTIMSSVGGVCMAALKELNLDRHTHIRYGWALMLAWSAVLGEAPL
jgi:hypothetical protein